MGRPTGKSPRVGALFSWIVELIEMHPIKVWFWIWAVTAVALGFMIVTAGLDTLNARGKGLLPFVALGWIPPLVAVLWQKRRNRTDGSGEDNP